MHLDAIGGDSAAGPEPGRRVHPSSGAAPAGAAGADGGTPRGDVPGAEMPVGVPRGDDPAGPGGDGRDTTRRVEPGPGLVRLGLVSAATFVATLVVFYALPIGRGSGTWFPLRIILFVLALAAVAAIFGWQVRLARDTSARRGLVQWLLAAIWVTVALFATAYYALAVNAPGELVGISTKTDSLYFTASVLTTVGFGDIHALGRLARVLVTVQMGFDVVFVGAAGAALRASGSRALRPAPDSSASPPDEA
jgi:hypothetical protein